jgi:NitT/TauT family transport system substrate-binding protein
MAKRLTMTKGAALTAATLLVFSVAACSGDETESVTAQGDGASCDTTGPDPVSVGFSIATPDAAGAYVYATEALGYYEDEGLDVDIVALNGSVETARQVATGQIDFAAGGTLEPVVQMVAQGEPLQAIMQYAYSPIFSMGVPVGSDVQGPEDLAGKSVGVVSAGSGSVAVLKYLIAESGIDPAEVNIVPIGLGPQAVSAIEQGRVDAVMFWDTAYVDFENAGLEFEYFSTEALEEGYASMGVYYNTERADDLPCDAEARFLRALAKGLLFVRTNPEAGIQAMGKVAPVVLENAELSTEKLARRVELHELPAAAGETIGWSDEANWERLQDVLIEGEVITEPVALDDIWNGEFLEAANDFDKGEIRREAQEYRP